MKRKKVRHPSAEAFQASTPARIAALFQQGAGEQAQAMCTALLAAGEGTAPALDELGKLAAGAGNLQLAEDLFRAAVEKHPDSAAYRVNLGTALMFQNRTSEACSSFGAATRIEPGNPQWHDRHGILLARLGRYAEAMAVHQTTVTLQPGFSGAWTNLGYACEGAGLAEQAESAYRTALMHQPDEHMALNNLGRLVNEKGRPGEAEVLLRQSIAVRPDYPGAHNNLGNALKSQGRLVDALAAYDACLRLQPDDHVAHSNRLLCLNYCFNDSPADFLAEHRSWEQRHAVPCYPAWRPHGNDRDGQRVLRVGFVSPDLRAHAVAQFLLPFIEAHDRSQVRVVCYACNALFDDMSARLQGAADEWVAAAGMSDQQLADRIRVDRIDILVELAGHTANNRLRMMARRPAPVQASWLGYLSTTGLQAIDYRIVDGITSPPAVESFNVERLARLPHSPWCYSPPALAPALSPLPLLANGFVTFGSINGFQKLNDRVLDLWARLLREVPAARLLALGVPEPMQGRVRERMLAQGVSPARLDLVDRLPRGDYYAAIARADLALDPFPFSGGTTTCDALWMGLPVVTLAGVQETSRSSASILTTLGLDGFVAGSEDAYIGIARQAVADAAAAQRLAIMRAAMRDRMRGTPLADPAAFSRALESLFRTMWQDWCHGSPSPRQD